MNPWEPVLKEKAATYCIEIEECFTGGKKTTSDEIVPSNPMEHRPACALIKSWKSYELIKKWVQVLVNERNWI